MKYEHQPHTPFRGKIIVTGVPKPDIDIDLLVEAILMIADKMPKELPATDDTPKPD